MPGLVCEAIVSLEVRDKAAMSAEPLEVVEVISAEMLGWTDHVRAQVVEIAARPALIPVAALLAEKVVVPFGVVDGR